MYNISGRPATLQLSKPTDMLLIKILSAAASSSPTRRGHMVTDSTPCSFLPMRKIVPAAFRLPSRLTTLPISHHHPMIPNSTKKERRMMMTRGRVLRPHVHHFLPMKTSTQKISIMSLPSLHVSGEVRKDGKSDLSLSIFKRVPGRDIPSGMVHKIKMAARTSEMMIHGACPPIGISGMCRSQARRRRKKRKTRFRSVCAGRRRINRIRCYSRLES